MIKYFSPSSHDLFIKDRSEFYIKYGVGDAGFPQTPAMAVGSAFDSFIKSRLATDLGLSCPDFFEDAVEPGLRDGARVDGMHCLNEYIRSGAYAMLLTEMDMAADVRFFEARVGATVSGAAGSVPLLGKPDLYFKIAGRWAVYDWKVNGFYSKSGASPAQGFLRLYEYGAGLKSHAAVRVGFTDGIMINTMNTFEKTDWIKQLCFYSWVLGFNVGSDFIVGVDQLVWRSGKCRVAQHRSMIDSAWQISLHERVVRDWEAVQAGYYFYDTMDRAASDARCRELDKLMEAPKWLTDMAR